MRRVKRLQRSRNRFELSAYDPEIQKKVDEVKIHPNERRDNAFEDIGMNVAATLIVDPSYEDEAPYYVMKLQKVCKIVAKRTMFSSFRRWRQRWFFVTSERANLSNDLSEISTGFMESIDVLRGLIERGPPQRVRGYLKQQKVKAAAKQKCRQQEPEPVRRPQPRQLKLSIVDQDSLDEWSLEDPRTMKQKGKQRPRRLTRGSHSATSSRSSVSSQSSRSSVSSLKLVKAPKNSLTGQMSSPVLKEDRGSQTEMALVVNGDETDKDSRSMASSEKGDDSYEEDIVCVVWSQSVSSETVHEEEETLVELADAQTENVSYPSQFDIVEEDRHAHTTVPVRSSVVVPEKVVSQTALVKRGDEEEDDILAEIESVTKLLSEVVSGDSAGSAKRQVGMSMTQNPTSEMLEKYDFEEPQVDQECMTVPT